MPKLDPPRPAAVYLPDLAGAQDALRSTLTSRRLYTLDRRTELLPDLRLPVVDRPVLRLCILHALVGPGTGAAVFVSDSLATLGDASERVAVVGALLQAGCEVVVAGEDLTGSWYSSRVQRLGWNAVGHIIDGLLTTETMPQSVWNERWPIGGKVSPLAILPTSLTLTYAEARLRAKDLYELERMPIKDIAPVLMAEGYLNADGRRIWYAKAVRDALGQGL